MAGRLVTARSTAGLRPANSGRPGPRLVSRTHAGQRAQHALGQQATRSKMVRGIRTKKLVRELARKRALREAIKRGAQKALARRLAVRMIPIVGTFAASDVGQDLFMLLRNQVAPTGFPGFGNFTAWWTSNPGTPYPGAAPGDYTANGFDKIDHWTTVARNMIDIGDGSAIAGFRYWGHYDADPLPDGAPAVDWTEVVMPTILPEASPLAAPRPRILPDLSETLTGPPPRPLPENVWIEVTFPAGKIRVGTDAPRQRPEIPRKRIKPPKVKPVEKKASLGDRYYQIMVQIIGIASESIEIIYDLIDAAGYDPDLPQASEYGYNSRISKLWWAFGPNNGIANLTFDEVWETILTNELEDRMIGRVGRRLARTAREWRLGHGFQTGPVL